jgi:hypothetical protein
MTETTEEWSEKDEIDEEKLILRKKKRAELQRFHRANYVHEYKTKRSLIPIITEIPHIDILQKMPLDMQEIQEYFNIHHPWNTHFYQMA